MPKLHDRMGVHPTKEFILVDKNHGDKGTYEVVAIAYIPKFKVTLTGRPVAIGGDFVDAVRIVTALNTQLKARQRKEARQ